VTPGRRARASAACLAAILVLPAASIDVGLDSAAVAEAVRTGRSPQADLERFHAAYRVPVDDPVVRGVAIVSEFRRIVLLTEERARLGDASWDAVRAEVAAREFRGRLDLVVELQFNPRNTFRSVPPYSVAIYRRASSGGALRPADSTLSASYVAGQPAPPGTPILAATVTATFDASRLDPSGPCLVAIFLDGREVRRVPVDLGAVR
jgi:hypothetical protein